VLGVFALLHGGVFAAQDVKTQAENPYLAISKRNAFDLTDSPPPAKDTPPPELPKNLDLKFTGIYRLKGVEKACLALIDSSAKPPETKYLQIPVGDKQGAIEITAIDAEAGTVSLIKDGSPLELSLKNNEHTYKTAVAKAPSKSSKSRSSSSKTSSRSSSGSRPTTGRSSGTTSSRSGSSPSRTSSSRSGSVSSLGGTRTTRSVPTRARRTYPTPPPMEGGNPDVQALEMIHQKDLAESMGVPMPPLPFGQQLEDAPPADAIRDDRPPMPPVPGGPIPPGG
jgi:cobalamin biosynthesis Mg chelatase CobN